MVCPPPEAGRAGPEAGGQLSSVTLHPYMKKTIVAFLQNLWVKNPDRVREMFARRPDGREFMLRMLLFRGGRTGKILRENLGQDLCNQIVWEESTTQIGGDAKSVFPPEPEHIRRVLLKHQPEIVLAFGKVAAQAVFGVLPALPPPAMVHFLSAPHPCARSAQDPRGAIRELRAKIEARQR